MYTWGILNASESIFATVQHSETQLFHFKHLFRLRAGSLTIKQESDFVSSNLRRTFFDFIQHAHVYTSLMLRAWAPNPTKQMSTPCLVVPVYYNFYLEHCLPIPLPNFRAATYSWRIFLMDSSPAMGTTQNKTIETSWTCNDGFADLYSHVHLANVEKPLHD